MSDCGHVTTSASMRLVHTVFRKSVKSRAAGFRLPRQNCLAYQPGLVVLLPKAFIYQLASISPPLTINIGLNSCDANHHTAKYHSLSTLLLRADIKIHEARPLARHTMSEKLSQDLENGASNSDAGKNGEETFQKQSLTTIVLLTTTSLMAMFLIALDRTIITTVRNHGPVYARLS